MFKVGADLQVIDIATFAVSRLAVPAAGARLRFGPAGKLFIGTTGGSEMWVHTPGTTLVTLLPNYATGVGAMVFDRSGNLWAQPAIDSDDIVQVDPADGTVLTTMTGDGRLHAGGHWLAVTPF